MKEIEVGCALIRDQGKILIAQRKPGDFLSGYWEFPGGKCEEGESLESCLRREVFEELGIEIRPERFLFTKIYPYSDRVVLLNFFLCHVISKVWLHKRDCWDYRWVTRQDLSQFLFVPGDLEIINALKRGQFRMG
ncbi:MAG: (deoxy)nucleoside triphosphate pyrophosphohydrolase [Candidatus Omnitrophica bacterium]|nr:(deoxy)nucleoside triphosphate pyrophosphohydrolase [Candidatus Omnitrophota bacterium]